MSSSAKLLLVFIAVILVNVTANLTLTHNLNAGVYPVDGDSIGIPMMSGVIASALVFVLLALSIYLPKRGLVWVSASIIIALLGFAISGLGFLAWLDKDHFPIAACWLGLSAISLFLARGYWRSLASNNSLQARPP